MLSRKIKILFVIDYFHRTGGTEKHLSQLVTHLPPEQFECAIVVFDLGPNPLVDEMRAHGVQVLHIPVAREYVPNAVVRAWQLAGFIRRERFDIVQTFHQKADTYGAIVARLAGTRHLVSSKRDTGELRRPWHVLINRSLKNLFERIVVVADAVGECVARQDHLDPARIARIYNGVDTREFQPPSPVEAAQAKTALGFAEDDFVVGMVAGFRPEKNHDVLFAAAARAAQVIPRLKVLAVGGGPLLESYRGQCATGALAGRVTFTGDVRKVAPCMRAMDVGCLVPGSNEGFSNSILEKMATGLPLVVTDVGGNREAVLQGENGFVIRPGDVAALSDALIALHADPVRRAAMGRRSRSLAEEKFSLQGMFDAYAKLYHSIC